MGIIYDLCQMRDRLCESGPRVYINTYKELDEYAVEFFKDHNIIVVTSDGTRWYHGKRKE